MARKTIPPWNLVLAVLRTATGWSQQELAAAAGTSPNLLSDYECGRKTLRPEKLRQLVLALELDPAAIDHALAFLRNVGRLGQRPLAERPQTAKREDPGFAPATTANRRLNTAIVQLRLLRAWNQKQLAAAAGVAACSISNYERGTKVPSRKTLAKLAAAAGVSLASLEQAAEALELLRSPSADRVEAPCRPHARSASLIEITPPIVKERLKARELWARLEKRTTAERRSLVERDRTFHSWALCELVCELSYKAAPDCAGRSLKLAELALRISQLCPGEESWRSRLQSHAWAHVANAYRVFGRLFAAEEALGSAKRLARSAGNSCSRPLNAGFVERAQIALLIAQYRAPEALELIDCALPGAHDEEIPFLIIQKARSLEHHGRYREAVSVARNALADAGVLADARLELCARFTLASSAWGCGRLRQAISLLPGLRAEVARTGNDLDLLRVEWLEARTTAGLGNSEAAAEGLRAVHAAFLARHLELDAALAGTELSALLCARGKHREARQLMGASKEILTRAGLPRAASECLRRVQSALGWHPASPATS